MYLRCVQYSDGGTTERVDGGNSKFTSFMSFRGLFFIFSSFTYIITKKKEILFSLLIAQSIVYLIIINLKMYVSSLY